MDRRKKERQHLYSVWAKRLGLGAVVAAGFLAEYWILRRKPKKVEPNLDLCERCIKLLDARAGLMLISHLVDHHGVSEEMAISKTEEWYRRILTVAERPNDKAADSASRAGSGTKGKR